MPDPQPKPVFTWERLGWAILTAVLAMFGFVPMMPLGCINPNPDIVVPPDPPPGPVVPTLKKVIVVRESGSQNDALALLVTSLQGGKGEKWLAEKGIELVGLVDPGDIDSQGNSCKIVTKLKTEIETATLPAAFLFDKDDKL